MQCRLIVALFAIAASQLALAQNQAPELPSGWTPKKPVSTRHDMVAAANPLAVEAGHQILKQGGSAVDAAVAVQMVLNLVEPQSSGIGGGAFELSSNWPSGEYRLTVAEVESRFPPVTQRFWFRAATPRGQGENSTPASPAKLEGVEVEFFPEGGDLVADLESRVYFRVRTPRGEPAALREHAKGRAGSCRSYARGSVAKFRARDPFVVANRAVD